MWLATGNTNCSPLGVVAVDPQFVAHTADLIDGIEQRCQHPPRGCVTRGRFNSLGPRRQFPNAPAAVPTRSAKAHFVGFDDQHPHGGVSGQQVVSCPQPGCAAADDGDVNLTVALKG